MIVLVFYFTVDPLFMIILFINLQFVGSMLIYSLMPMESKWQNIIECFNEGFVLFTGIWLFLYTGLIQDPV